MDMYTKEFTGLISYKVLSEYHFSAKMIYETCLKHNQPFEVDYNYEVNIKAVDIESATQQFIDFANRLNELEIIYHLPNLTYIIKNWQILEGSFPEVDSLQHKQIKSMVEQLITVVKLRDNPKELNLEVYHSKQKKNGDNYINLKDVNVISDGLQALATSLLKQIKQHENIIPYELVDEIMAINEPNLGDLLALNDNLINVTDKVFNSGLVYTICETVRKYLKEQTQLNPSGVFLTNDQARVIYDICVMYSVIPPNEDYMDFDKLNYIKAVLRNGRNKGWEVEEPTVTTIWNSEV